MTIRHYKPLSVSVITLLLSITFAALVPINIQAEEPNTTQNTGESLPQTDQAFPAQEPTQESPQDSTANKTEENKANSENGKTNKEQQTAAKPRVNISDSKINFKRHQEVLDYLKLYGRESESVKLSADNEDFYALFLQERSGKPQGAILILHDIQQHGHWPELVAPLRENLPDYGWITLSIELPNRPEIRVNNQRIIESTEPVSAENKKTENESATDNMDTEVEEDTGDANKQDDITNKKDAPSTTPDTQEEISDNEPELPKLSSLPALKSKTDATPADSEPESDPMQDYRYKVSARINSALDYLRSRGQFNLVIVGAGEAALWAADATANLDKKEGLALVIINAHKSPAQDVSLIDKIGKLELPILDLITVENVRNKHKLKMRKGEMRHRNHAEYTQIFLPHYTGYADALNPNRHAHPVVRRVRGWLKSKAAGTSLPISATPKEDSDKP